jgi:SEC-C motif
LPERSYLARYDFDKLHLTEVDKRALDELQTFNLSSARHLTAMMQFPEPGYALDLSSRASIKRQYKHIHQMCTLHATHFQMANQVKTTYIVDEYLWAASRLNPIALYSSARSLLELHAMLRYVQHLLAAACTEEEGDWRNRGQRYFSIILQARFGTTDPQAKEFLIKAGVSPKSVQLIRLREARQTLAKEFAWVEPHYAMLCDFVHHNMSSQRTGAYAGESLVARNGYGGVLVFSEPTSVVQYEFPRMEAGRRAVGQTARRALENLQGLVSALDEFPKSPFSPKELKATTGSSLGLEALNATMRPDYSKVGRNEPCPCGSGQKYKKCHGA